MLLALFDSNHCLSRYVNRWLIRDTKHEVGILERAAKVRFSKFPVSSNFMVPTSIVR